MQGDNSGRHSVCFSKGACETHFPLPQHSLRITPLSCFCPSCFILAAPGQQLNQVAIRRPVPLKDTAIYPSPMLPSFHSKSLLITHISKSFLSSFLVYFEFPADSHGSRLPSSSGPICSWIDKGCAFRSKSAWTQIIIHSFLHSFNKYLLNAGAE